jgi:hypothetical protein
LRLEFELPVVVRARYGRGAAEKTVIGFVPHVAEIAEYELRDAPLALAYQQTGLDSPSLMRVEYRALEGSLWVNAGDSAPSTAISLTMGIKSVPSFFAGRRGIAENIEVIMRKLAAHKKQPAQAFAPNSLVVHVVERGAEYRFEPLMGLPIQGAFEEQVISQIETFDQLLRGFVVIDGHVYRKEREPLIRLYPDGQWLSAGIERRGHASHPIRIPHALPRSVGWFRLDDRAGMVEEAEAIIAAIGNPGPLNDRISRIEVYDQSLLQAAPEGLAVYDVADAMRRHFQSGFSSDRDSNEPGDAIGRWLAEAPIRHVKYFKAISGKLRGDPMLDDVSADLEEAFMAIADDESGEFELFSGKDRLKIFANEVARRWRDRPVTMNFLAKPQGLLV